jgi:hypothetical protein
MAVNPPPAAPPAEPPVVTPEQYATQQDELNRLRALVEFPLADREILDLIHGSPEQIKAAAKNLHDKATAAAAAAQPQAPAPAPAPANVPPAPGPAPVPGPGQANPPEQIEQARYGELFYKVENRIAEPHERQEFFMASLRNGWNQQVGQMKERHA